MLALLCHGDTDIKKHSNNGMVDAWLSKGILVLPQDVWLDCWAQKETMSKFKFKIWTQE